MPNFTKDDMAKLGLTEVSPGVYQNINKGIGNNPYKFKKTDHIIPKQWLDDYTYLGINSKPLIVFDINPIGAPRMTKSDQWKTIDHKDPKKRQRKPVTQYFRFKNEIRYQAEKHGFKMPENSFHVIFLIQMPTSWSEKKKNQMNNSPHQSKPDLDNAFKALSDSLCESDAYLYDYRITKYWSRSGRIIIFNI